MSGARARSCCRRARYGQSRYGGHDIITRRLAPPTLTSDGLTYPAPPDSTGDFHFSAPVSLSPVIMLVRGVPHSHHDQVAIHEGVLGLRRPGQRASAKVLPGVLVPVLACASSC